jgi:hypothetical protein
MNDYGENGERNFEKNIAVIHLMFTKHILKLGEIFSFSNVKNCA